MGEEKKKKGLGGLSPEKKKQLKKLIMAKAAEDLKNEAIKKKQERDKYVKDRIAELQIDGLDKSGLMKICNKFHKGIALAHDELYDIEVKIRKQDLEIYELNTKVNDAKGKFHRPVLKKVSRTDAKFKKLEKKKTKKLDVVELKSSGTSKYALGDEEKKEDENKEDEPEDEEEEEEEEE